MLRKYIGTRFPVTFYANPSAKLTHRLNSLYVIGNELASNLQYRSACYYSSYSSFPHDVMTFNQSILILPISYNIKYQFYRCESSRRTFLHTFLLFMRKKGLLAPMY